MPNNNDNPLGDIFDSIPDLRSLFKEMAQLTILSGRLNKMQEDNLKMWPFVFFNGVKSAMMKYDLASPDAPFMEYHLVIDESEPNAELDQRFTALESSVRAILWNTIKLSVYFNDIRVYESSVNERRE